MAGQSLQHVLLVGHCESDQRAITQLIESRFDAIVETTSQIDPALKLLCQNPYELVLVNRTFDVTSEEGIELIRRIKESPYIRHTPVMLVSNFDTAQQEAISLGAVPGFGKADLQSPAVYETLALYL